MDSEPAARSKEFVGEQYRPLRLLASGGAGAVYEAQHTQTGQRVALKLLHQASATAGALARFETEARILASISSEHVVRLLDASRHSSQQPTAYLAMELLDGRTLEDEASEPMAPAQVVEVMTQLALGLEQVHARGVVHCDVKPENVFLTRRSDGSLSIKLLDFGIALLPVRAADDSKGIWGTPMYMSPEQARGERASIDRRTDTWALGLVAFRLLSGRSYFPLDVMERMLLRTVFAPIEAPSKIGCHASAAFDAWFLRSCSRDVERRFRSTIEQAHGLSQALAGLKKVRVSAVTPAAEDPWEPPSTVTRRRTPQRGRLGKRLLWVTRTLSALPLLLGMSCVAPEQGDLRSRDSPVASDCDSAAGGELAFTLLAQSTLK